MSANVAVLFDSLGAHVSLDGDASSGEVRATLDELAAGLRSAQKRLATHSMDDILGLFDSAGQEWVRAGNATGPAISRLGLGFLPLWLRRNNLEAVVSRALRGNLAAGDRFVEESPGCAGMHRAQPRGLIVHWVAGNVPMLGMISTVQGLLSKNGNIVKLSHKNAAILPFLLDALSRVSYRRPDGSEIQGTVLTDAVIAVYFARDEVEAAKVLSMLADVRVAWGGREAVESIMGLPRRFGTEDIVFGPKLSFAVIGVEALANQEAARRAARQLSADATALDQRGCNSPHTVFVERGAAIGPAAFAEILADELHQGSRRRALPDCGVPEAFAVLGTRAEYDMRGLAWYSEDVRWSVFYAEEDRGMAEPRFCSSLFVRPVDNIFDVTQFCSIHTQTAGLAVGERRTPLADALTAQGVDRCTQLGQMTVYDNPWDGMYPIDRMVRWVSLK